MLINKSYKRRWNNFFLPPPPLPPPFEFFNMQSVPNVGHFLNNNIDNFSFPPLPLPPPLPLRPIRQFYQAKPPSLPPQILTFKRENDAGANTTKTLSGDFLKGDLEKVIEKENLDPGEDIIFTSAK